jgi:hypothetical protein
MKARLLIVNPMAAQDTPLAPMLVIQDEAIGLYSAGHWSPPIRRDTLEAVTGEDIRNALRIPAQVNVPIYLSEVRDLPTDDLLSGELLFWARQWWQECVAELAREESLAKAS